MAFMGLKSLMITTMKIPQVITNIKDEYLLCSEILCLTMHVRQYVTDTLGEIYR